MCQLVLPRMQQAHLVEVADVRREGKDLTALEQGLGGPCVRVPRLGEGPSAWEDFRFSDSLAHGNAGPSRRLRIEQKLLSRGAKRWSPMSNAY